MRTVRIALAFAISCTGLWGQGTSFSPLTWVKPLPNGYPVKTIAQFDKSVWLDSRQVYSMWGEYKQATFSEQNDAMGFYSYAENRWHMVSQAASQHNTSHPPGGHQWGYTTY